MRWVSSGASGAVHQAPFCYYPLFMIMYIGFGFSFFLQIVGGGTPLGQGIRERTRMEPRESTGLGRNVDSRPSKVVLFPYFLALAPCALHHCILQHNSASNGGAASGDGDRMLFRMYNCVDDWFMAEFFCDLGILYVFHFFER